MRKIRNNSKELTTNVNEIHNNFHVFGNELLDILIKLASEQKYLNNVNNTIELIKNCKKIIQLMIEIKDNITGSFHYQAMLQIETIKIEIQKISYKIFIIYVNNWIINITKKLLDTIKLHINDILQSLYLNIDIIGETLLKRLSKVITDNYYMKINNTNTTVGNIVYPIKLTTTLPSLSIIEIYKCYDLMKFSKWMKTGELDVMIPNNFIDEPLQQGIFINCSFVIFSFACITISIV